MFDLEALKAAVVDGEATQARQITEAAVQAGVAPDSIFSIALAPAMEEVGRRMQRNEYYIPEVLISAKAMKAASEILKPLIAQSGSVQRKGKAVMGTVKGDLHDIGKNLVVMMLEGAGMEVVDLGSDASPERFVEAVKQHQPEVVGMSALLTTTMLQMGKVVQALDAAGLRQSVKIMIGGAPVNEKYRQEIGADGFGADAAAAAEMAKVWVAQAGER